MNAVPDILYQDEQIVAINKHAGLLSIPDGYDRSLPHAAGVLAEIFGKVWIVHRLDRETSGVMLLARTLAAHRQLNIQFEHRQIQKVYHALVCGLPAWQEIETQAPLLVNADRKHRTLVSLLNGKPAQTSFCILQRFLTTCLVEARPHSGYTHQIRIHLAALGFPILQDRLYAAIPGHPAPSIQLPLTVGTIDRVALHAQSICFSHPTSQEILELTAPYPPDFQNAVKELQE